MADCGPAAAISIAGVTGASSAIDGICQKRITRHRPKLSGPGSHVQGSADDDRSTAIH